MFYLFFFETLPMLRDGYNLHFIILCSKRKDLRQRLVFIQRRASPLNTRRYVTTSTQTCRNENRFEIKPDRRKK